MSYKGFSGQLQREARKKRVSQFSIQTFFEEYGRSCVWATPKFDADTAPLNIYSSHFWRIAKAIKEQRGYRCENPKCRIDLSDSAHKRFLHAHHIDADKADNHPKNIRLLCIRCHANAFQHAHLKDNPDYKRFVRLFGT